MDKVRFGIIGVGNQGSYYALSVFCKGLVKNGVLSAVCDINEQKLEHIKNNLNDESVFYTTDYKELLIGDKVDAVIIAVPHYSHPSISIDFLKNNISVLCDKPAGVYAKHVKEMNKVAEKSNAKFGLMFNQRTNCLYRKMREMVKGGEIGTLQRVTWIITDWFRSQAYYDMGSWRATWQGEGGGVLINQCPHQLDLVSWVVGELPKRLSGFCKYGKWHDIEVEDDVTAYFEYANGATGMFITTTGETPGTNRFEISGTKGKLLCENGKLWFYKNSEDSGEFIKTTPEAFKRPDIEIIEVQTDGENPQHVGIINNFANAVLGTEELFVDGKEGIFGVELMNGIEYSGLLDGKMVNMPVNENKYLRKLNKLRAKSKLKSGTDKVANTAGSF